LQRSLTDQETRSDLPGKAFAPRFLTNAGEPLRYPQSSLIRCALMGSAAS
jgi:hypothetical protein